MIFPIAKQKPACRENLPRMPSHRGHHASPLASGMQSHSRSSATNRASSIRLRPAGTAARNARTPGSASEQRMARAVMVELARRRSQATLSVQVVNSFCFRVNAAATVSGNAQQPHRHLQHQVARAAGDGSPHRLGHTAGRILPQRPGRQLPHQPPSVAPAHPGAGRGWPAPTAPHPGEGQSAG